MTTRGGGSGPGGRARLLLALGAFAIASCSPPPADPGSSPSKAAKSATKAEGAVETRDYPLRGEVRKVDPGASEVVIRHEPIPGFMPAMTMPFKLPAGTDFEDFQVGDVVEGTLKVKSRGGETVDYDLIGLEVARPAIATPLAAEASEGGAGPADRLRVGDEVPDFEMIDQEGERRKLSDFRGTVVALTFVYTRCPLPDFCPMMDRKFSELSRSIAASESRASHVRLLSLSFDPEHDTPEVLREHARIRGAKPPVWTYAAVPAGELARVAPRLGLAYGPVKGEFVHNLCTAVIGPDGRLARLEVGSRANAWTAADLLRTIAGLIPAGGR